MTVSIPLWFVAGAVGFGLGVALTIALLVAIGQRMNNRSAP